MVAVVGAGLSGLTAAFRLARAGKDVVVLEAGERVGGRAWRVDVGGLPFDAGCEVFDRAHGSLLALADEVGVPTWEDERWAHPDDASPAVRALEEEIAGLTARIDPARPEDTEDAGALDGETLAGRLAQLGASREELAEAEVRYAVASSTVPIAEMSLLAYAAKLTAGAAPGGLTMRFDGGPSELAGRLAAELEGRVRLGARVTRLEQERTGVRLRLAGGEQIAVARAIVAVPLTLQRELGFDPPLPPWRQTGLEWARYGDAVKAAWAYDEIPRLRLPQVGPGGVLYRPHPRRPLLTLFAGAGAAREAGAQTVGRPRATTLVDWRTQPFARGSYLIFGPGDLTSWGRRLAEPHRRVHFAGAETSNLPSYMEGAVRAGERVADEVLAAG